VLSRPPNYIQGRGRDGRANGKGIGEREMATRRREDWERREGRKRRKERRVGSHGCALPKLNPG